MLYSLRLFLKEHRKIKSVLEKSTLLLTSILMSFLLMELAVRLFNLAPSVITRLGPFRIVDNPNIVYEFMPGSYIDGSRINHQGFKDADFIKEKPKNVIRIAMLGDSITQGMGVVLGKTFSDRLKELLNEEAKSANSNIRYEVMNFGVGGYNLGAEVEVLKTKALEYRPDIVVLNFFHNDDEPLPGIQLFFVDNKVMSEEQKIVLFKKYFAQRNSVIHRFTRSVLYKSKLFAFVMYRINNIDKDKLRLMTYVSKHHNDIMEDKTNKVFLTYLSEIDALRKKYGFKFMACLHPHLLHGVHPNNKKFEEALKRFGFPYFNMFDYYKAEKITVEAIELSKEDTCHPNEFGYLIVARAMLRELKKNKFLDY